ncbi:RNA polymerase sigma factor [Prevotella aurantiaca]|jgi:RNA polymerase sigma factor, sigma-70 family|uniref:RNA polymerase sigma factor n=1 Tax=Prevotella aurantiaca TaxID=596085 RepID=UPI001CADC438|nr:sigma-70 family RNA polymerase sigma factor [Prevotella aurantiaca]MBF1385454.1 sigma-70 family RNA polymerase sigma factor [Prevotella aurantiaca]
MEIETFNKMVVSLRSRLLRVAATLEGGDVEAEDFVQETFLRMWAMRHKLDHHPNVEALALKIIKGIAIDHWRHRKLESAEGEHPKELATESGSMATKDDMELIKMIVDHLPPLQQQIFRLKDIDGYENEEIAKICGCSAEAVRQNLSRARRRIQKEFIRLTNIEEKICK